MWSKNLVFCVKLGLNFFHKTNPSIFLTTCLEYLWKIRCWIIVLTTSTQYLKTNSFATFPMHTNEKSLEKALGLRIFEKEKWKHEQENILGWNFNRNSWIYCFKLLSKIYLINFARYTILQDSENKHVDIVIVYRYKVRSGLYYYILIHFWFSISIHSVRTDLRHATSPNIFHLSFTLLLYTIFYC